MKSGEWVEHHNNRSGGSSARSAGPAASHAMQSDAHVRRTRLKSMSRVGLCAMALSSMAAVGTATAQAPAAPGEREVLDEIQVTGSRIQRTGMTTPTPVTTLSADDLDRLAPTTLIDALDQMPQFVNNATPVTINTWGGNAGASILNLRGIGSNRTLTLLDGRRVVPSTRLGTTDVNIFPEHVIQRVETVTGGASAAYGSDAVSGVVNFILDTDFTGVRGNAQGGMTSRGQGENYKFSLAAGTAVGERGHLLLAGDYYESDGIRTWDKYSWYEDWGQLTNPAWSASDPPGTNPQRIDLPNMRVRTYTHDGLITSGPLAGTQFLPDGTPAPFFDGDVVSGNVQSGGSGVDMEHYYWPTTANKRNSLFAHYKHDLNDNLELFIQGMHGRSQSDTDKGPNMIHGPWAGRIFVDNAFLNETLRQQMIDTGQESFGFARSGAQDLGGSRAVMDNNTYSLTTGLQGEVGGWRINSYYQYGINKQEVMLHDTVRIDRVYRAMDAVVDPETGRVVCRSTLTVPDDGCVPANFFGDGSVTAAAREYIQDTQGLLQDVKQHFAEVVADGEIYEGWGAGPVSLAVGASYRRDSFDQNALVPDVSGGDSNCFQGAAESAAAGYRGIPPAYSGCVARFERGGIAKVNGNFDVKEVFTEALVPLLRGATAAESVDVSLAWRYADYSGSGGVHAWKAGVDWSLTEDLRLRGTRSRDTRAGTLSERFDTSTGGTNVTDPFVPGAPTYAATQISGGNPEVDPEKADTWVLGVVYQPSWFDGFGISMDYFDVRIEGAINSLGVQRTVDGCFEDNIQTLCDRIGRGAVQPGSEFFDELGPITTIINTFLNVNESRARGIDFESIYRTQLSLLGRDGNLTFRGIVTHIIESSDTIDGVKTDNAGDTARPPWRGNLTATYNVGDWSFYLQQNFIGSAKRNANWVTGVDIENNRVASFTTTSARIGYDFEAAGGGDWNVFFHVSNLFDRAPPLAPAAFGEFFGSGHSNYGTYDPFGRRYSAGLRFRY